MRTRHSFFPRVQARSRPCRRALRQRRPAPGLQPRPDPTGVVSNPDQRLAIRVSRRLNERAGGLELRQFRPLPRREADRQREPVPFADEMGLRRQAAQAPAERLSRRAPLSAPPSRRGRRLRPYGRGCTGWRRRARRPRSRACRTRR